MVLGFNFVLMFCFSYYFSKLQDDEINFFTGAVILLGPLTSIGLNCFKYGSEDKNFYQICMMVSYHANFISGGVMFGIWQDRIKKSIGYFKNTALWPIFIVGGVMLFGAFQPGNHSDVGFMNFYPIYYDTVIQSMHTNGSWMVIYFLNWFMEHECNKIYSTTFYKLFTGSSMSTYLCHDLWI